ncbi:MULTISPECIES: serine hydrolase [unclassified Rhodococcus (in: high G+C Gram-positive bacteria)]|uniref:serine hydrolase domain-containing protein n=1 Tax=unclassified Rhodococcus (in: high G+C Gram-positive bacteria) TaxID=192944 RepID=UPI00278AE79E|nr:MULTISPECIES: serine hydrolase domain-containing protein [unclassified Rhodococcus (in: high G+C Gram-positive bacteria)]MDQ1201067.1 CubicO group peptidase (beta-lactamase class C family) [Rhodococcus sp. SORGH_AS_0303]
MVTGNASEILSSLTDWPVPAVSAAVITDGPDVAARHGDRDRVQELASVTKLLVAYAALVAVEEGAVELDEAAGPEGSTVRHLLAHTSGVAFDDRRPTTAPGTKRIYSSAGFEILAEHVTERSGIEFGEYLSAAVLEPLGMTSTELHGSAGHGARSNLCDMEAFAAELLAPTLVSRQTVDEATSVQFEGLGGILPGYGSQRPNDWGLGFELRDHKSPHWTGETNSARTFGHFGQSGTFLWVDPEARVSCVVLADRAFGDWAKPLWTALGDTVLAGV